MERYFAEIQNDTVVRVVVADSVDWCISALGGEWVETFANDDNKNYASIGYKYHRDKDNFSSPKIYDSWNLDEKCRWNPPVKKPDNLSGKAWSEKDKKYKTINEVNSEKGIIIK